MKNRIAVRQLSTTPHSSRTERILVIPVLADEPIQSFACGRHGEMASLRESEEASRSRVTASSTTGPKRNSSVGGPLGSLAGPAS
jgi:hypothetical protein